MKIIGLIEEHSNRNKFSQPYKEFRKGIFNSSKLQILDYLNQGVLFATTMQVVSSLEANDKTIIGGIAYYTDGKWIWPNYLVYYLTKYDIEIPKYFVDSTKEIGNINNKIDVEKAISFLKNNNII